MPRKKNTPRTRRMRTMRVAKRRRLNLPEPETTPEIVDNTPEEFSDHESEDDSEPEPQSEDSDDHLGDFLLETDEECSTDEEDSRYDFRFT